ncbi:MAG: SDR family oxidoreductase [Gammaproteobacteria bacterium]
MKNILIIGASSGIGLECVHAGLSAGYKVFAFARTVDKIELEDKFLTKITGDALHESDLENALYDIDVVIQVLGVPFNKKMITGPITLFSKATEILLPLMITRDVKRLITVTGYGAGRSKDTIGFFQRIGFEIVFGRAYRDKDQQEKLILDSDLDWTIVRPGILTNGSKTPDYQILYKENEWKNGLVSRKNISDYIVKSINDKTSYKKDPVIIN